MAGYLGLALLQNLHEIADTDFAAIHEIEQAQTGGVGKSGKEANQV